MHYLHAIGERVKTIMVHQAVAPKSGRIYTLRGGQTYQASAPGEYPANKTGDLAKSYHVEVNAREVTIGTDIPVYPTYLRTGTHKMAPRRFLMDALHDAVSIEHMQQSFVRFGKL